MIQCPKCEKRWETLGAFLSDSGVALLGYQVHFLQLTSGFFLFNHIACGTTLGVEAAQFLPFGDSPVFAECQREEGRCPSHCLHSGESPEPPALCDCTFVQLIVQTIQNWPKKR